MTQIILKNDNGDLFNLSGQPPFKKSFYNCRVNIAKQCNEAGLYKLSNVIVEDPFAPDVTKNVWCMVRTMVLGGDLKYQEVIWDSGRFFRGTYQGDNKYLPWRTLYWEGHYNLDDLVARVSALESKIGGVLTRLFNCLLHRSSYRKVAM